MNETHCSYGYYQDTSEYVKKNGGHHASPNGIDIRNTGTFHYIMELTS